MKNFIFGLLKLLAACFGPLCMLYSEKLFDKYFTSGKNNSDEIYSVILNNHGSYRYITEAQDQHIKIFFRIGRFMSLLPFYCNLHNKIQKIDPLFLS
jgi:hypothetical protein